MNQRHYLLKGTFILTLSGLLTRVAGFFYKIFLSRTIGAAEIGRFQLILPVLAFGTALSCGGIQTAVSRFTAEYYAEKDSRAALRILACALLLSGSVSAACAAALFLGAPWIARCFLMEPSCTALLRMAALSLPFSAVHGCIGGFFIGRRNVSVSASAQFVEQFLRIASVLLLFILCRKNGWQADASLMALGQIAGELSSALFCMYHLLFGRNSPLPDCGFPGGHRTHGAEATVKADPAGRQSRPLSSPERRLFPGRADFGRTLSVSAPLGLNRMLVCVLQGIEAALLPQMLRRFGCSGAQALAVYGTLSGMSMPLLMFPTAVTAALGTLLLPAVSEARALRQDKKIAGTIDASFRGSLLLGLFFFCAFLLFGGNIGGLLFHSRLAGIFTRKLAPLCPFLYINTTLISILHGLGATTLVTAWNIAGFGIRLAATVFLVPDKGIDGYLAGMLLSQAFLTVCILTTLYRHHNFRTDPMQALVLPGFLCLVSSAGTLISKNALPYLGRTSWGSVFFLAGIYTALFLVSAFFLLSPGNGRRKLLRQHPS